MMSVPSLRFFRHINTIWAVQFNFPCKVNNRKSFPKDTPLQHQMEKMHNKNPNSKNSTVIPSRQFSSWSLIYGLLFKDPARVFLRYFLNQRSTSSHVESLKKQFNLEDCVHATYDTCRLDFGSVFVILIILQALQFIYY